jgi:hypothetical protein
MATQKFMGKNQLVDRLAAQVGSKESAMSILQKRGHMDEKGNLTAAGRARDNMTAEERAIDRAKKASPGGKFVYNPKTNRATKRR